MGGHTPDCWGFKSSRYRLRAIDQKETNRRLRAERLAAERAAAQRAAAERKRREVLAQRVNKAKGTLSDLEARLSRLALATEGLRAQFPMEQVDLTIPRLSIPNVEAPELLENLAAKVTGELEKAEAALLSIGKKARANSEFRNAAQSAAKLCAAKSVSAEDVLAQFMQLTKANRDQKLVLDRRAQLDRIIGRYPQGDLVRVLAKLKPLIVEALSTDSDSRFDGLEIEIRRQIQDMNAANVLAKANAAKAEGLLEALEKAIPLGEDQLKQRLELVRAGAIALPDGLETEVHGAIASAQRDRRVREQALASAIMRDTLSDLGYEASPVDETLFVKGGRVFFRRAGWDDYCVRLIVRPEEEELSFNLVKMDDVTEDAGNPARDADLDEEHAACVGYLEFADTLRARGLETEVFRRLPAGELPVQRVRTSDVPLPSLSSSRRSRKAPPARKRQPK